ncbi:MULTISPECIES: Fic family protein [Actinotignum]|uniref:Fic family protein n=1 Tax=Actinotignum TaxID=1653174 RepID=UPI00254DD925|nr:MULTISPECIES: Fic family protein [Actinotignum]MDE1536925.1 Fic family protein [Actinotignum schaalii]MDK7271186.1 Fic family protein [Actinotignum schaalii]MDY5144039.1 Fic family protein [Actinotignum timonense]
MRRLNEVAVERWLARRGFYVRSRAGLRSCFQGAFGKMYGVELYSSPHEKAAKILLEVETQHPLFDGNKRLGALLCEALLNEFGFELMMNDDALADMCFAVAGGQLRDLAQITELLKENSRPGFANSLQLAPEAE